MLGWYITAFWHLDRERGASGRIPWTSVEDYADRHEMRGAIRGVLHDVVAMLDHAYLGWKADQEKKARRTASKSRRR